jgi:hypothetical protein
LIERNVDISCQHSMRAIRLFIAEGEESGSEASAVQERQEGPLAGGEEKRTSVTYQPSEQASPLLRGDEFANQLRLARIDCGQRARETAELGAGGYHGN